MINKAISISFIAIFAVFILLSCEEYTGQQQLETMPITSYLEIPGITDEEIAAVEALKARGTTLIYASSQSTELFEQYDGTLGGYTVLLCEWLTRLFDIQFQPEIMGLGAMLENLRSGQISFATLSATPERRQSYFMVDIAQRSIIMLRAEGSLHFSTIRQDRLPRFVFTEGSVMTNLAIEALEPGSYEAIIVRDENSAFQMLISGQADAFIAATNMEAAFDQYGGIYAEDFLPLIFLPAAMTAENPEYKAIISLVTKALESGAYEYLAELYRQGYQDYRRQKFSMLLSEEELAFLRDNPVIPFITMHMAYPNSFYNTNSGEWQGIIYEVLNEMTLLTGLNFKQVNDNTVELPELLNLVENGTAYFMPNMILSAERRERFIFSSVMYLSDRFALLSKQSYPNIELNDIPFQRVGLPSSSAFTDMFRHWFPNALYAMEYPTTDDVFAALDRGEVDLVMSSLSRLAALTNYYEFSDYKVNYLFNSAFEATFGFNKDQFILCSIIDKALPMINTERIVEQWSSRTYNIETMRLRAQRPWLISATVLSLLVLFLVLVMLLKNSKMTARLKATIAEVNIANIQAETANKTKSAFLANMSHELRTPLNSTLNMIKKAMTATEYEKSIEALHQAAASSNDLLSVLNTILEISNIESGKLILINSPFILGKVVLDINNLISTLCRAKDILWEPRTAIIDNLSVLGDRIRLMQVLTILLRNAVKSASEEQGKISFIIDLLEETEKAAKIRFEVSDNGIGMTEKKLDDLTQMFTQDINDIHYSSSEIMLSACNSIVKTMGSQINVESEPGKGSSFSFTINFPKALMPDQPEDIEPSEVDFTGKRVLVVDDIQINRIVLKNILTQAGIEVIEANDGRQAVDIFLAESENIDIILMDIMMPNMDGYEAAREIRASQLSCCKTVPIIAVTTLTYKEDVDAAIDAGMNFHLGKPVEPKTLLFALLQFLSTEKSKTS